MEIANSLEKRWEEGHFFLLEINKGGLSPQTDIGGSTGGRWMRGGGCGHQFFIKKIEYD